MLLAVLASCMLGYLPEDLRMYYPRFGYQTRAYGSSQLVLPIFDLGDCEFVTGDTGSLGSKSQTHMQRAGLQIAFTRSL
ncbi:MAG: hypothetical protein ABI234_01130 [Ktedonobacteraceae bacterium]